MKNKIKKFTFFLLLNIFILTNVIAQEISFEANSIELKDNDKRIIAKNNVKIFNEKEVIYADEMDYNKLNQIITAKGNIRIENLEENIKVFSDELTYIKNEEKIILTKNVKIDFGKKLTFKTEKIVYDKIKKQILINNFSNFTDNFGNKIISKSSKYLFNQKLLKINYPV